MPGVQYSYSGGGYTIMQKMLSDVTGKAFPELMEETVLLSSHYVKVYGKTLLAGTMPAAGLWTTPSDLLKYAAEMLTPQLNNHGPGPGTGGTGDSITFGHGGPMRDSGSGFDS